MKPKTSRLRLAKTLALPALISLTAWSSARAQSATDNTWTGSTSLDWNISGNWAAGLPDTGENAGISNGNTVSTSADAAADLGQLLINGSSTLNLGHILGTTGTGGLWVGAGGSAGILNVNNGGAISVATDGNFRIGSSNNGLLTLASGGSIISAVTINIGREAGGNGTFTQTGGTLTQSGGEFWVGAYGANGVFNISNGTSNISSLRLSFAGSGTGTINQSGGIVNQSGEGAIGWANSGDATYNLSGGTLNFLDNRMRFGIGSAVRTNLFNQTGGDVVVSGRIDIGEEAGASNIYQLSAGSVTANEILVGAYVGSNGTFSVSGSGSLTTGNLNLGTYSTATGVVNLNGGTASVNQVYAGGSTSTQTLNFDGGKLKARQDNGSFIGNQATLVVDIKAGGGTIDSNGFIIGTSKVLAGVGKLTKTGAGILQLNAINTYQGGTTISGGMIQIKADAGLGDPSVASNFTFSGNGGALKNNGNGTEIILVGNRTVVIEGGAKATFVPGWDKNITIDSKVSGAGDLVIANEGKAVILTNSANDYTGNTVIGDTVFGFGNAGGATLRLGASNVIGDVGTLMFDAVTTGKNAKLDMNGFNEGISGLSRQSATAFISNGSGTTSILTVGLNNATSSFDGVVQNGISLIKTGSGTLTLSGTNTYTGTTAINGGTMKLGNATALGATAGTTTLTAGATLDLNGQTISETISAIEGTGVSGRALTNSSVSAAEIKGAITSINGFSVGGTGDVTLGTVKNSANFTMTKVDANTLTLGDGSGAADNGYLNLLVNAGSVILSKTSTSSIHAASKITIDGAGASVQLAGTNGDQIYNGGNVTITQGTFDVNTRSETVTDITIGTSTKSGSIIGTTGVLTATGAIHARNGSVAAILDGTIALDKTTGGMVTLSGANTYTGATLITGGTLQVSGSIGDSAVTVSNPGTILASGATGTIGKSVSVGTTAILDAGGKQGLGKATVGADGLSFSSGSIFDWDLAATLTDDGGGAVRGTDLDAVNTASLSGNAIFRVVLNGSQNFAASFWDVDHSWNGIFKTADGGSALDIASIFTDGIQYYNGSGSIGNTNTSGRSFTMNGSTLNWSAVPEPTTTLAGMLLVAGLLRRRRYA